MLWHHEFLVFWFCNFILTTSITLFYYRESKVPRKWSIWEPAPISRHWLWYRLMCERCLHKLSHYSVTVTALLESRLMWCLAILLASTQPKLPWKMFGFWELADNLISLVISLWNCTWNPERSESSCRNKTLQRWKRSKLNTVSLTSVAPAWKWFVSASWDVKTSSSCCSSNKGYKI